MVTLASRKTRIVIVKFSVKQFGCSPDLHCIVAWLPDLVSVAGEVL